MSSAFSIGQMNQLADACEAAGYDSGDITKLGQSGHLRDIRSLLFGHAEIRPIRHIIDCDTAPRVPDGWKVENHKPGGKLEWNAGMVQLYLSARQQGEKCLEGNKLRQELEGKPVLNANVLDYLLDHPALIPVEWKGKRIYFWGTIYRGSSGSLYVRYLRWDDLRFDWIFKWLDDGFFSNGPAALLASQELGS